MAVEVPLRTREDFKGPMPDNSLVACKKLEEKIELRLGIAVSYMMDFEFEFLKEISEPCHNYYMKGIL